MSETGGLSIRARHISGPSLANATSYEVQVIRSDGQLIWSKVVSEPDATVPLEPGQSFMINVFPIGSFTLANFSSVPAQSIQGTALVVVGQTAPLRQGDQQLVWKLQSRRGAFLRPWGQRTLFHAGTNAISNRFVRANLSEKVALMLRASHVAS